MIRSDVLLVNQCSSCCLLIPIYDTRLLINRWSGPLEYVVRVKAEVGVERRDKMTE